MARVSMKKILAQTTRPEDVPVGSIIQVDDRLFKVTSLPGKITSSLPPDYKPNPKLFIAKGRLLGRDRRGFSNISDRLIGFGEGTSGLSKWSFLEYGTWFIKK